MNAGRLMIDVVHGDALQCPADVLVLKFAQALYGVDEAVYRLLSKAGVAAQLPAVGASAYHDAPGGVRPPLLVFLGVPRIGIFSYADVRELGRRTLAELAEGVPAARHVATTLHGAGFGLDEIEAFEAQFAGLVDAIEAGDRPPALQRISFVEHDSGRARRLQAALHRLLPTGVWQPGAARLEPAARSAINTAGAASADKPKLFVAMPFAAEMNDTFHYGIQGAANAAGLLCERADMASFTGDVMEWVKQRISAARLVVADLSTANPNVYLEVGYAWGRGVPTVLLAKAGQELKFDVRAQRCIVYESIHHLETRLADELKALVPAA